MGDVPRRAACWRGFTVFINYSEGDKRLIKRCWVAVTSSFLSSSSPRGAQGLHSQ